MARQRGLQPPLDPDGEGEHLYLLASSWSSRLGRRAPATVYAATACRLRRPSRRKYASFESWEPLRPPLITDALLPAPLGMRGEFLFFPAAASFGVGGTTPALHFGWSLEILKEMKRNF
ncbi:unnamed protein product [Urochloa humidicola]